MPVVDGAPIYASFFFVDIVGLSDPSLSVVDQVNKIKVLNQCIADCESFKSTADDLKIILPTGDGMVIGFLQWPSLPLTLAIELHRALHHFNKDKDKARAVRVRIGLHSGPVFVVDDIRKSRNVWGQGIVIARRIMDIGNADHILLSAKMAEDIRELSDEFKKLVHPLDYYTVKHGKEIFVYSAYGKDFGNPNAPTVFKQIREIQYDFVRVAAVVKDPKTMLVHYKRQYAVRNISDQPLKSVNNQISSDIDKKFDELNLQVYDNRRKTLKIAEILVDKPRRKDFTVNFNKPIPSGERGVYTVEYDVEEPERYFENIFLTSCAQFQMVLKYPDDNRNSLRISPAIYEIDIGGDEKVLSTIKGTLKKDGKNKIFTWSKSHVVRGKAYRIEW